MSQLSIYRASAGSGKTYTLTREYLNLVFENPLNYKSILAVTFTNKATDEMKSRIIKEIHCLASGKSSSYEAELCENHKLNSEELRLRAQEILNRLLHDYSRFSITTIDSFFQKIVRSFTREIGLQLGYSIELDQTSVLNEVVDLLFADVDKDQQLKSWLSGFAESKIKEGKTWNFKKDILGLGSEVFKEEFKNFSGQLIEKLSDKKFLNVYRNTLQQIKSDFEDFFSEIGTKARNSIERNGLEISDFAYGKAGVAGYLTKLGEGGKMEPGSRARAAIDTPEKWTSAKAGSDTKQAVGEVYSASLNDLLKKAVSHYDEQFFLYNSTDKTLSNIYTLGILTDLSRKVHEYSEAENIFLLSDASRLLRNIIGDNDSPFIYEKIGNVYKHFMIDEFQDTSSMQWANFKPLVTNSLAEENHSLVVGDVKQSIYRWRNGDWKILSEQLDKDFINYGVNALTLNFNWRSSRNVIDFNNALFSLGAQILQNDYNASIPNEIVDSLKPEQKKIVGAYQDIYQYYPKGDESQTGYVRANFIQNTPDLDWTEKVLEDVPLQIEQIQQKGYRARDIAILVRNGKEGGQLADCLMAYRNSEKAQKGINYDVISNDSLYLKNSTTINFLVHLLSYFVRPDDKINRGFLQQEYLYYLSEKESESADCMYYVSEDADCFETIFPREFTARITMLKRQALYDLVEELIQIFSLNKRKEDIPFLEAFQDVVLSFSKTDAPDLNSFVNYWEDRKNKEVISVSDQQDAIRIMTIHKSKGLEFKVVILPFCSWDLDNTKHANILWCQPKLDGFNALDVLPVRYSSGLKETIYYQEYFTEKMQSYIDNFNLLYVATTRAEKVLLTYSPLSEKRSMRKVADLMLHAFENSANYSSNFTGNEIISLNEYWDKESCSFELGRIEIVGNHEETEEKDFREEYPAFMLDDRLKLRAHSADYFDFSEAESVETFSPVSRGNILHQLFQLIEVKDDLPRAVAQLQFEGKLDKNQAKEVKHFAEKLLNNKQVEAWFSKDWKVVNERDILLCDGGKQRPDRVICKENTAIVIDYKFGKKREESHKRQVISYKKLIKQLGFENVTGFVLYGKLSEIEEV